MSRVAAVNVTIGDRCFLVGDTVPDEYAAMATDPALWQSDAPVEPEATEVAEDGDADTANVEPEGNAGDTDGDAPAEPETGQEPAPEPEPEQPEAEPEQPEAARKPARPRKK